MLSVDIDEKAIREEKPEVLVMVLAKAKADTIMRKLQDAGSPENTTLLIAADTVVVYEGMIREKSPSKEEAHQFFNDYSGGHASTVSSVLVTKLGNGFRKGDWDKVEIEEGIVLNVAGGLIIEHPLILPYVNEVVGETDSVMGLPKAINTKAT